MAMSATDLKRNMFVSQPNLKLLLPVFVFLGPFGIVFFHDLAVFNDPFDLGDHQRTDTHCVGLVTAISGGTRAAYSLSE